MSLYMAIVVYAPALALAQVTGFNVYISVSLICFVCIFYTTLGGMKAVLWTDALQVTDSGIVSREFIAYVRCKSLKSSLFDHRYHHYSFGRE